MFEGGVSKTMNNSSQIYNQGLDSRVIVIALIGFTIAFLYYISRKFDAYLIEKFNYSLYEQEASQYSLVGMISMLIALMFYANKEAFIVAYVAIFFGICFFFLLLKVNIQKTDYINGVLASLLQLVISIGTTVYFLMKIIFKLVACIIAFIFRPVPKWKIEEEERNREILRQNILFAKRWREEEEEKKKRRETYL